MADDLRWSGAWRKLGPEDGMGMVTGVKVGVGGAIAPEPAPRPRARAPQGGPAEALRVEAEQMGSPGDDTIRSCGRVRMART